MKLPHTVSPILLRLSAIAATVFFAILPAQAQTDGTWTADANGNWSDGTKWADGLVANGAGATATFNRTGFAATRTITLDANRTIGTLKAIGNPGVSRGVTIDGTGTVLTFNHGANAAVLGNEGSGTLIVSPAISLESSLNIYNNSNGSSYYMTVKSISSATVGVKTVSFANSLQRINLSGSISDGTGTVAVVANMGGAGDLRITTGHSFTGGLSLLSGKYRLFSGANNTSLGAGEVTLSGGMIDVLNDLGSFNFSNKLNLTSNNTGTFQVSVGSTINWTGQITGAGALTKTGAGTFVVGAQNNYFGGTKLNAGTLQTDTLGTLGTGDVNLAANTTLLLGNNASIDDSAVLTFDLSALIGLNYTGEMTIAGLGTSSKTIDNGTYSIEDLNAFFGGSNFSGTGSITVIPEANSVGAILSLCALAALGARRRKQ